LPSNEPSPPQPAQVSQQTAPIIPQPATKNPLPTTNQPAQAIPTQTGQIVTANVIGHEPTDESLLQTPIGTIRLAPGTTLPPRSTATLEITQITPPAAQNTTGVNAPIIQTSPPTATLPQLAQQWSALQQIFDLLAGRPTNTGLDTPPAPPTPNATNTPTPQPTITPQSVSTGLMSFIAALRSGNFDDWLGKNNVKWLQDSGHTDVLQKAAGEFTTLATQFTAPPTPHQWQSLFFPVAVEGQLQQVRMYTKRDRKQDGGQGDNQKNKGGDDTRFIIEVDLSKLGELQMDGFVRRADQSMQFDMIIRSLTALPKEIQQDILHIYNETGALTGYKGTLVFQSVKEFPVNPMNEIIASAKTVLA